jgi:hypothetical protein
MKFNQSEHLRYANNGREQFIANAAFMALFPGFFFYHTLQAQPGLFWAVTFLLFQLSLRFH